MTQTSNGIVTVKSKYRFPETFQGLDSLIVSRGMIVFARIDFSEDAKHAGLQLNPTKLIIFGNPKGGTPLMQASPSVAIDFPLKILVSTDNSGNTWLSYNSLQYLKERHNIPEGLLKNISGIENIVSTVST